MIFTGLGLLPVASTNVPVMDPNDQEEIGLSAQKEAPQRADVSIACTAYGEDMTNSDLSLVRWIDLDASLTRPCSWCRHSEFIHSDIGPCLFSECSCQHFLPMTKPS